MLFSVAVAKFYIPPNSAQATSKPIFPYPSQHSLFCGLFLIAAILMDMRRYLIVVFVCISLVISDVEHLFIAHCPLFIFFGKMSVQVFCLFFNCVAFAFLFTFLLRSSLYFQCFDYDKLRCGFLSSYFTWSL